MLGWSLRASQDKTAEIPLGGTQNLLYFSIKAKKYVNKKGKPMFLIQEDKCNEISIIETCWDDTHNWHIALKVH